MKTALLTSLAAAALLAGPAGAATKAAPKSTPAKPPAVAPAPALATPLAGEPQMFAVFRTVCVGHQGDLAAAEAEARSQGFVIMPPDADEDPAVAKTRTMLKRESQDLPMVVILVHAPPEVLEGAPNAEATLCGVSGPDPGNSVAAAAKTWIGLESNSQDGNHLTYLYRQTPTQRLALSDQSDLSVKAAIAAGEFRVFDIDPEDAGVTLGLMTGLTRTPAPAG